MEQKNSGWNLPNPKWSTITILDSKTESDSVYLAGAVSPKICLKDNGGITSVVCSLLLSSDKLNWYKMKDESTGADKEYVFGEGQCIDTTTDTYGFSYLKLVSTVAPSGDNIIFDVMTNIF